MILGPRIFSTGEIVYGAKQARSYAQIDSFDDALAHVRRLKAAGRAQRARTTTSRAASSASSSSQAARAREHAGGGRGRSPSFGLDMTHRRRRQFDPRAQHPARSMFYEDVLSFFSADQDQLHAHPGGDLRRAGGRPLLARRTPTCSPSRSSSAHIPPTELRGRQCAPRHRPRGQLRRRRQRPRGAQAGQARRAGLHRRPRPAGRRRARIGSCGRSSAAALSPMEALQAGTIVPPASLGMDADIGSLEAGQAGRPRGARRRPHRRHPQQREGPSRHGGRAALRPPHPQRSGHRRSQARRSGGRRRPNERRPHRRRFRHRRLAAPRPFTGRVADLDDVQARKAIFALSDTAQRQAPSTWTCPSR